jgi:hypothetical protein
MKAMVDMTVAGSTWTDTKEHRSKRMTGWAGEDYEGTYRVDEY